MLNSWVDYIVMNICNVNYKIKNYNYETRKFIVSFIGIIDWTIGVKFWKK